MFQAVHRDGIANNMPKEIEEKLKKEYPHNDHAVFGTMNKLGLMKGNKETPKGKKEEKKHEMATKMRRTEAKGRHYETYLGKK